MAGKNKGSKRSGGSKRKDRKGEDVGQHAGLAVADMPSGSAATDDFAGGVDQSMPGREAGGKGRKARKRKKQAPAPELGTAERKGRGGKASDGGLLTRVAALGEYGAALGEYGREGLAKAGTAVRTGASAVRTRASAAKQAAAEGFERGREITAEGWNSHPLAFCGAALVVGAAIGVLLPSTTVEDNVMGTAADRFNRRLRTAADGVLDQGKDLVGRALTEATAATTRGAEQVGLTPERIGRKVKRLASHVRQAVTDVIE